MKQFRADYFEDNQPNVLIATVRYDDQCNNGYNTFSITADLYQVYRQTGEPTVQHNGRTLWLNSCGQLHDEIRKHLPELAPYLKWHLVSEDGPLHYIANTLYHAKEHGPSYAFIYYNGLSDPLGIGGTDERLIGYYPAESAIKAEGEAGYRVRWDKNTAKVANLDYARKCAIWPDASLEELRDEGKLRARLPKLMEDFTKDLATLGLI